MGNVNLPTPVALAAGALCLLGGYLLGWVSGPDAPARATGTVQSYDAGSGRLCLTGEGVEEQEGAEDGRLCGTWRRGQDSRTPQRGDAFRFVSLVVDSSRADEADAGPVTVIYGDVAS
jgi:hypothetical protein